MGVLGQTAMILDIFSKESKDLVDSLYQLIHSQPLNTKNLESSYSCFPIPIGEEYIMLVMGQTLTVIFSLAYGLRDNNTSYSNVSSSDKALLWYFSKIGYIGHS